MAKSTIPPTGRGIPLHAQSIEYWAERQKQLRRDLPRWNQVRSSLDAIRQTHRAIEAFNRSNGDLTEDQRYLAIYGLLQALVVQQDAISHLAEALRTKPVFLSRHTRLEEIRRLRNWTVGHPTKVDRYDTASHHAIQRTQLGRGGFSLYSAFDDGREQYTYVPLPQLARLQRRVVSSVLRDILLQLNSQSREKKKVPGVRVTPSSHSIQAHMPASRRAAPQAKPQRHKHGMLPQHAPRFAATRPPIKKAVQRRDRRVPILIPLPGERFANRRAAA